MTTHTHGRLEAQDPAEGHGRTQSRLWKRPAMVAALIQLIPLAGNTFVDGWNWAPGAFVLLGGLVFALGLVYELLTRRLDAAAYRIAIGISLVAVFLLLWVNLVQGADDINPAANVYFGVPIVGVLGALLARLKPKGMSRALFAMALAQAAAIAAVLMLWDSTLFPWTPAALRGFVANTVFAVVFVGAALLCRKAARGKPAPELSR